MNRKNSFKNNNNKKGNLLYRPKSVKKEGPSFFIKKNISTIQTQMPPILFTIPNNKSKKLNGLGNDFEREELYKINMQLKETINSLKVELHDAKSQIVKKEREIKKKEKIIDDCCKEIQNPTSQYMKSFDKAKESTLLILCKEQYAQLKNNYDQKLEEIEILKSNIKITNLKEYQISIDVLKKEMNKLRNLYYNMVDENDKLKDEIDKLNEYKDKFNEQHNIINKCAKKVEDCNNNIMQLEFQNGNLEMKLKQNKRKNELMKNKNNKLQIKNDILLKQRRNRERFQMFNADNIYKITNLEKEVNELKKLNTLKDQRLQALEKQVDSQKRNNLNIVVNKEFDYNRIHQIEQRPAGNQDENLNKISLLKSLLEEKQKNLDTLKNFLSSLGYNPEKIIQNYNSNLNGSENNNWSDIYRNGNNNNSNGNNNPSAGYYGANIISNNINSESYNNGNNRINDNINNNQSDNINSQSDNHFHNNNNENNNQSNNNNRKDNEINNNHSGNNSGANNNEENNSQKYNGAVIHGISSNEEEQES